MKTKTIGKVTVTSNREFTMLTPDRRSLMEALREEEHRYKKKLLIELKQIDRLYQEARGRVRFVSMAIQHEKNRLKVLRDKITNYLNKLQIPDKYKSDIMKLKMQVERRRLRGLESMLYRYNDVLNNYKKKQHNLQKRLDHEHLENVNRIRTEFYKLFKTAQVSI